MTLSSLISLCDALVLLMKPLVEIVIHDLDSHTITYKNGDLSKRSVGDPSLLETTEFEENINTLVYPKLNFDGRLVKSISVPMDNKWLVCLNCDVSIFHQMKTLGDHFLHASVKNKPGSLFKNDWQEKLHITLHGWLDQKKWNFDALSHAQKKEAIKFLFDEGAFEEKKATDYIADVFSLGRATLFNYLKQWRA